MKKVCVVGLGYIGLPTAIVAAEAGYHVFGYDIDARKVDSINAGDPSMHEPELFEKLQYVLGAKLFSASCTISPADYFVIAVPTPINENKTADLSYVKSAIDTVMSVITQGNSIIVESTVPVGFTNQLADYIAQKYGFNAGADYHLAHCPERVLPGNIFYELVANDRVVGVHSSNSIDAIKAFYEAFVKGQIHITNVHTAEMVKLVENSARDVQLAFSHEVDRMAHAVGLNAYEVIELANKHPRVHILRPTAGVGGHCIAVDPWFLVQSFPKESHLIHTSRTINDARPVEVAQRIEREIDLLIEAGVEKPNVLLLGLTYKPNIDDIRESPALRVAQLLHENKQVATFVHDPHIDEESVKNNFGLQAVSLINGITCADIVVFLVAHDRFKLIDRDSVREKKILDFCGILYESISSKKEKPVFGVVHGMVDFFIANQVSDKIDMM